MRQQVAELAQTLWAARRGDELMDTVTQIETLKSTLDALELDVTRELEATHAVKPMGWASTQDFLTAVAGGHKACGPAMVRLAQAVETPVFAPVGEAMADGWLSTVKAQVIVRAVEHLPGDTDLRSRGVQVLLDEAKRLDATGLAKAGRYLIERVDPDGQARRDEAALEQGGARRAPRPRVLVQVRRRRRVPVRGPRLRRGRGQAQGHPDGTRPSRCRATARSATQRPATHQGAGTTAGIPATTAPGCSTPSSSSATEPPRRPCSRSATAPRPGCR